MVDSHKRTIAKSITWRIVATATTILTIWIWTGSWYMSLGSGLLANGFKAVFYYIHERAWNNSDYGRKAVTIHQHKKKK